MCIIWVLKGWFEAFITTAFVICISERGSWLGGRMAGIMKSLFELLETCALMLAWFDIVRHSRLNEPSNCHSKLRLWTRTSSRSFPRIYMTEGMIGRWWVVHLTLWLSFLKDWLPLWLLPTFPHLKMTTQYQKDRWIEGQNIPDIKHGIEWPPTRDTFFQAD
jgi:hypothetical protein